MDIKNKKIVAITGCAAGIAHTFMAAEGIEKAAKELGAKAKVETHGTAGPDNVLTAKDIRDADLVIIAADIAVKKDRFVGKVLYETNTHLAIADPKKLIEESFEKATKYKAGAVSISGGSSTTATGPAQKESKVLKHIMFSLSWMVPLIIAGGLVMAVGNVFAMQPGWVGTTGYGFMGGVDSTAAGFDVANLAPGIYIDLSVAPDNVAKLVNDGLWFRVDSSVWNQDYVYVVLNQDIDGALSGDLYMTGIAYMNATGTSLFEWGKVWSFAGREFFNVLFNGGHAAMILIYPVIAAGIAYSIAGKISFAPAFLGGWLMNDGSFLNTSVNGDPFGTGFLGALAVGFFIGYLSLLFKKIRVNRNLKGLCDLMLWPFIMSLIIVVVGRYIFGPPLSWMTLQMFNGIIWVGDLPGGNILLAAIVAGMICTDLGGPINKTALVAGTAIFLASQQASMNPNDWNFVPGTATQAAISVPPLIAFGSVTLFGKYFTQQERTLGTNASVMGCVGITEGAIPFAVSRPKTFIPAFIVGGMVSGMLVTSFQFQFYGGLGSPLAPILGYVPSALIGNYILSTMVWILCYLTGVAVGLSVVWVLLFVTFKSEKQSRLIREAKAEAKEQINGLKYTNKTIDNLKTIAKNEKQIELIKTELADKISEIKKRTPEENSKSLKTKKELENKENIRWEKEEITLKQKIEETSKAKDKDKDNYKSKLVSLKKEFKDKIATVKSDISLTKEDKNFTIETIREEQNLATVKLQNTFDSLKAINAYKTGKQLHKDNIKTINSDYVKNVT